MSGKACAFTDTTNETIEGYTGRSFVRSLLRHSHLKGCAIGCVANGWRRESDCRDGSGKKIHNFVASGQIVRQIGRQCCTEAMTRNEQLVVLVLFVAVQSLELTYNIFILDSVFRCLLKHIAWNMRGTVKVSKTTTGRRENVDCQVDTKQSLHKDTQ